jgi:hypothetical protein
MSKLESLSLDELQSYLSDFHKDYYGFRPRGIYTPSEWSNRDVLIEAINRIHDEMDELKKTPEGRAMLAADGWVFNESETI